MLQLRDKHVLADTDTALNAHQAHEQRMCHNSGRIATLAKLSRGKGSRRHCDK
jgi:hypothetical protein